MEESEKYMHEIGWIFKSGTPNYEKNQMIRRIRELERLIPYIKELKITKGICEINGEICQGKFEMIFADEEDHKKYQKNSEHEKVSRIIKERTECIRWKNYSLN